MKNLFWTIQRRTAALFSSFMKFSLIKKVVIGVVTLLLIFGVTKIFRGNSNQPQYQTETAQKGTLIESVTGSGTVTASNKASITSSATGVVNDVLVGNGAYVNQGDTIATITLDQQSLERQESAWANYLAAQNSLNTTKSKMNSLQSALFKANQAFITDKGVNNPSDAQQQDPKYIEERADWLQAESDYNNQQGQITQAQAALASAWLSYSLTSGTITAPISGTVSNLTLTPGMAIAGSGSQSPSSSTTGANASGNGAASSTGAGGSQSFGSVVMEQNLKEAVVNLSEIDVTKVKIGQKVTITMDAFPDKTFTGHVSAINTDGTISSGVTTYPTTIDFDTAVDTIYPNMAVSAKIIIDVKSDVILVPTSAIQTTNGASTVRILRNNKVQTVDVETGASNETQTEITSGIKEGDVVITSSTTPSTSTRNQTGTSPFGGGGFGGFRGGGGGGFGGNVRIQSR